MIINANIIRKQTSLKSSKYNTLVVDNAFE